MYQGRKQPHNPIIGPVRPGIKRLAPEFRDAGKNWNVDVNRVLREQESNPMNYSCVLAVPRDANQTQYGAKSYTSKVNKEVRFPYRDPDLQHPLSRLPRPTTQFINWSKYPTLYPMDMPAREYEKYINRKDAGNILETPYVGHCLTGGVGADEFGITSYGGTHERSLPEAEYTTLASVPVENFTYIDSNTESLELQESTPIVKDPYIGTGPTYQTNNGEWSGVMTEVPYREHSEVSSGYSGQSQLADLQEYPEFMSYEPIETVPTVPVHSGFQNRTYEPQIEHQSDVQTIIEPLNLGFLENSRAIPFSQVIENTLNEKGYVKDDRLGRLSYTNRERSRDMQGASMMSSAMSSYNTSQRTETRKGHLAQVTIPRALRPNATQREDSETGKVRIM